MAEDGLINFYPGTEDGLLDEPTIYPVLMNGSQDPSAVVSAEDVDLVMKILPPEGETVVMDAGGGSETLQERMESINRRIEAYRHEAALLPEGSDVRHRMLEDAAALEQTYALMWKTVREAEKRQREAERVQGSRRSRASKGKPKFPGIYDVANHYKAVMRLKESDEEFMKRLSGGQTASTREMRASLHAWCSRCLADLAATFPDYMPYVGEKDVNRHDRDVQRKRKKSQKQKEAKKQRAPAKEDGPPEELTTQADAPAPCME